MLLTLRRCSRQVQQAAVYARQVQQTTERPAQPRHYMPWHVQLQRAHAIFASTAPPMNSGGQMRGSLTHCSYHAACFLARSSDMGSRWSLSRITHPTNQSHFVDVRWLRMQLQRPIQGRQSRASRLPPAQEGAAGRLRP
eukprot:364282-Chlamydomonas_euryale.AAC.34